MLDRIKKLALRQSNMANLKIPVAQLLLFFILEKKRSEKSYKNWP